MTEADDPAVDAGTGPVPAIEPGQAVDQLTPLVDEVDAEQAQTPAAEPAADALWEPDAVDRPTGAQRMVINGKVIYTKPLTRWASSAMQVFNEGAFNQFYLFAQGALLPESLAVWRAVDPNYVEFMAMRAEWIDRANADPGKSQPSSAS